MEIITYRRKKSYNEAWYNDFLMAEEDSKNISVVENTILILMAVRFMQPW